MRSSVTLIDGYCLLHTTRAGEEPTQGGLYRRDTRFLTGIDVGFDDRTIESIGAELVAPNRQIARYADGFSSVNEISESGDDKRTSLVLERDRTVSRDGTFRDEIAVTNYSNAPVSERLSVQFDADFADLFEVRGSNAGIDRTIESTVGRDTVAYGYEFEAADGSRAGFRTVVEFDPVPDELDAGTARYDVDLAGQDAEVVTVDVATTILGPDRRSSTTEIPATIPVIESDRDGYARVFEQASADLEALVADSNDGPVLLAGAPWFATMFGRDSLLAAFQVLPVAPELATGVLSYLASHQATTSDRSRRAEPGKIFHEIRHGELARRGAIEYDPFYGTIDATALWIVLLDETVRWTGNGDLVEELAAPLDAALEWILVAMDGVANDPFVYYEATDGDPLTHTAWKDSEMSVQFADGTEASPPLASVEVQGYVYDALVRGAHLLRTYRDEPRRAEDLEARATKLSDRFDERFWLPDRSYYATALADDGTQVDALTSNVGQCLWSGIVDPERSDAVVDRLFSDELYSGWGIRSMSTADAGYSPVSYHVGSVWPHDNSLIALGLARYGYATQVDRLSTDLLDACSNLADDRMPEVFCGFSDETGPVPYPASCEPQAWGAGAPYALVRALVEVPPPGPGSPTLPNERFGLRHRSVELFESG